MELGQALEIIEQTLHQHDFKMWVDKTMEGVNVTVQKSMKGCLYDLTSMSLRLKNLDGDEKEAHRYVMELTLDALRLIGRGNK